MILTFVIFLTLGLIEPAKLPLGLDDPLLSHARAEFMGKYLLTIVPNTPRPRALSRSSLIVEGFANPMEHNER